jgi:hypothetical protein
VVSSELVNGDAADEPRRAEQQVATAVRRRDDDKLTRRKGSSGADGAPAGDVQLSELKVQFQPMASCIILVPSACGRYIMFPLILMNFIDRISSTYKQFQYFLFYVVWKNVDCTKYMIFFRARIYLLCKEKIDSL